MKKQPRFLLPLILIIGTLSQTISLIRSGLVYPFGLGFWGASSHDGLWHIALSTQVFKAFPIPHPTFSGYILQNYHPFFNYLLKLLSTLTFVPLKIFYFQFMPLILGLSIGFFSYRLALKWTKNQKTALLFTFLNYFASSFGWIVTLLRSGQIAGESLFWAMQSPSTLINPPYALSLLLILLLLYLLPLDKDPDPKTTFFIVLLSALIPITKSYGGLFAFLILGFWFLQKPSKSRFLTVFASFLLAFLFFLPFNQSSGGLFVFQPFWFVHSLVESLDKLYLPQLAALRLNLSQQAFSWKFPFLIILELFLAFLFLLGNFAFRLLGLKIFFKKTKNFFYLLLFPSLISILLPLLFIQKGTAWNSIQFMYYALFSFNLFLAAFLTKIKKNYLLATLLVLIFIGNAGTYLDYLGWPPPVKITKEELEAIEFLKKQPDGVVLTPPFQKETFEKTPKPLYQTETTAYLTALSEKQSFLADQMNLSISDYPWSQRKTLLDQFFKKQLDVYQSRGLLVNNDISYLYLTPPDSLPYLDSDLGLKKIFSNGNATIYQVLK
jgi:hypothetical protein